MKKVKKYRDNAQASVKKLGTHTLCSYRCQRLEKTGVAPEYWTRVCSPLGAQFAYTKLDTPISITPIRDIPNPLVSKTVSKLLNENYDFAPGNCYTNALLLADILNKAGVRVRCVDGYYNIYGEWFKHRFNELDGLFFDATTEVFAHTPLTLIKYQGVRLFECKELIAVAAAFSFLDNRPYYLFTTSTLPRNRQYYSLSDDIGNYHNEYCLDDNGVVCLNNKDITV